MKLTPAVRVIAVLAVIKLVLGAALLWLAATTPWHSDSNAYFAELQRLRATLYFGQPDAETFKHATARFGALQTQYATRKWLYADLAYAALSLGACMVVVAAFAARFGARLLRTQKSAVVVLSVTLLALAATLAGLAADPLHRYYREQLPEWFALEIPLAGALVAMIPIATVTLLLVVPPLILRRRASGPLLVFTRPPHWPAIVANTFYALPLAFAVFLLTSFASRGGWALAPAGLMLLWLFLNGRALWIAPQGSAKSEEVAR